MPEKKKRIFLSIKNRMKHYIYKAGRTFLNITAPLWVGVLKYCAKTGAGTDLCMKHGFLPMQVHYYSPIPDIEDLEKRQVWNKKSDLTGIDFRPEKQVKLLQELGEKYGVECNWPGKPIDDDPLKFYTENNSYSFGCAAALHTILRSHKPKKVIEIGSGFSSVVITSAMEKNKSEGRAGEYIIIDPYPNMVTEIKLPGVKEVIKERVELTEMGRFEQLGKGDVLFIDSGHTVRTGGDVNYLYLDVLPRLAPGVIVHIHDICLPYEYPKVYYTNPSFRVFWTEAYLLQAFLTYNSQFEVMLAMGYLMTDQSEEFKKAFRYYDPSIHKSISGSFWIQRK